MISAKSPTFGVQTLPWRAGRENSNETYAFYRFRGYRFRGKAWIHAEFTGNLRISPEITISRENLGKPLKTPQRVAAEIPKILLLLIGDPSMARAQTHPFHENGGFGAQMVDLPY